MNHPVGRCLLVAIVATLALVKSVVGGFPGTPFCTFEDGVDVNDCRRAVDGLRGSGSQPKGYGYSYGGCKVQYTYESNDVRTDGASAASAADQILDTCDATGYFIVDLGDGKTTTVTISKCTVCQYGACVPCSSPGVGGLNLRVVPRYSPVMRRLAGPPTCQEDNRPWSDACCGSGAATRAGGCYQLADKLEAMGNVPLDLPYREGDFGCDLAVEAADQNPGVVASQAGATVRQLTSLCASQAAVAQMEATLNGGRAVLVAGLICNQYGYGGGGACAP